MINHIRKISYKNAVMYEKCNSHTPLVKRKQLHKNNCYLRLRYKYLIKCTGTKQSELCIFFYNADENDITLIAKIECNGYENDCYSLRTLSLYVDDITRNRSYYWNAFNKLYETKRYVANILSEDLMQDIIRYRKYKCLE